MIVGTIALVLVFIGVPLYLIVDELRGGPPEAGGR